MKTKKIMIALVAVLTMSVAFVNAQASKSGIEKVTFNVNMTCQNCVNKVEKNIAFEKGVKTMDVNLEAKTVTLTYDSKKTDKVKLQEALTKLGYDVSETSVKGEKACCSKTSACTDKKEGGCCKEGTAKACADKKEGCCSKDSVSTKACSDKKEGACCKEGIADKACSDKKEGGCCKEGTAVKACSDKKEGASCKSEVVASSDAKKAPACCQTSTK